MNEVILDGINIINIKRLQDERGYFMESFRKESLQNNLIHEDFIQENISLSHENVLRGLHFQNPPFAQAKLVTVLQGSVFEVAVDLRKGSSTFGKYFSTILDSDNPRWIYIPIGFAHGFQTLEDNTLFSYKCSNYYNRESEDAIAWNDPEINITWPLQNPLISEKDLKNKLLSQFNSPF